MNEILTESEDDDENQDDLDDDQDSSDSRYSAALDQSKIEAKSIAKSIRNEQTPAKKLETNKNENSKAVSPFN